MKETSSTVDVTNHYVAATPMGDALWMVGGKTERLFLPLISK